MGPVDTDIAILAHHGLILAATCAQLLVLYCLSASPNPPRGLGLFTGYFMAALMSWVLLALQDGPGGTGGGLDVGAISALVAGYLLFAACAQRLQWTRGRWLFGGACLLASLSAFYLSPESMFTVRMGGTALFWAAAGALAGRRAWRQHNAGDGLIASAAVLMVAAVIVSWWRWRGGADQARSEDLANAAYSIAYLVVLVGFLASVLLDYQQRLAQAVTEDPLTRLFNRRGIGDALAVSLARAARHQQPMSAILLDLDHFRTINDSFGPEAGDQVLQQVAQFLQRSCRGSDVIARIGGEEFLLVLPNTRADDARKLADRLCTDLAARPVLASGQSISITASLGVASALGETDIDQLAGAAERGVRQAKRAGGNRVASVDSQPHHFRSPPSQAGA